jgi:ATP-binding cassette, sub-family E, member 1
MARIAVVRKDRCNPQGCGGHLCIRVCPINRTGKDCIVKGANNKPTIDEALCTGCGICPNRCPFEAISIINLPEELDSEPIHRYGQNDFALYSLPMPLFGQVVGIVGKNGIGKSTAIKILASVLKPNFGTDKPVSYDQLISHFKGTEMQLFFEKQKRGEITVAYKPQNVEAKNAKGTVGELLKKVDQKGELATLAKKLGIEPILSSDITKISGGEMQRVAIAATVLKKANVYIFDEPTSYLDIKQRLLVSKFIKELATPEVAVLVIEHDLVALDYMADLVHIMYGKEGCYGVVSLPKAAKAGINIYLDGYMKEENIRFRDTKIKFDVKPPVDTSRPNVLASWPHLKKKLGTFKLEAKEGSVYRHETVGVLGENGIGKTSFVKLLAGVDKPDSGELEGFVTVSYKPQYLETDSDDIVATLIREAIERFSTDVVKPLNLTPLLTKKLSELSGGELQRVAIARALSQKADLILLDEPSAYLDVEQRLIISKIIRNLADLKGFSVMVVDHDLVFIDYLSDRLLVFEGEPAVKGVAHGPFSMEEGMNHLLKDVGITLRRDVESGRPRINKPGSQKDSEQKKSGKYYYA